MDKIIERKTFSKILLAIDELMTSTTDRVIDYAINIAQDYDAQLVIIHVIRADINLHSVNPPSYIIGMRKEAQAYFVKITEKIHKEDDKRENSLRIRTEIIASVRVADAIVSYAKDKHIDLIITGIRGRSKLKSFLISSVASDIVLYAHCPVLTVKSK